MTNGKELDRLLLNHRSFYRPYVISLTDSPKIFIANFKSEKEASLMNLGEVLMHEVRYGFRVGRKRAKT